MAPFSAMLRTGITALDMWDEETMCAKTSVQSQRSNEIILASFVNRYMERLRARQPK